MPGYSKLQHQTVVNLVASYKSDLNSVSKDELHLSHLIRVLRLAVILCMRRKDDVLPKIAIQAENESLILALPQTWLIQHPLMQAELEQEIKYQAKAGWDFNLTIY